MSHLLKPLGFLFALVPLLLVVVLVFAGLVASVVLSRLWRGVNSRARVRSLLADADRR